LAAAAQRLHLVTGGVVRARMTTHIALVGAGNVCDHWLPPVSGLWWVELDAVVDLDAERAEDTLTRHGVNATVRTDLDGALAELRPRIVVDLTRLPTEGRSPRLRSRPAPR
jgi:predicted dehydrogenase